MDRVYFNYAPLTLMILGIGFGIAGYSIDFYMPYHMAREVWFILTILFAALGLRSGEIVKNLYHNLYNDILTGLKNRRFFYLKLSCEMKKIINNKKPTTLLMIDVDNFKSVNDNYGHVYGDKVLVDMANVFKNSTRGSDTVVRWGGEEFAIILPNTDTSMALRIAERIRKNVEEHDFNYKDTSLRVTISIGAVTAKDEIHVDHFVSLADQALYKAKERKNIVVQYEQFFVNKNIIS